MFPIVRYASPNFDERDPEVVRQYAVIHYTGMPTGLAAIERLCDPVAKVSAHYVIEEDGRIFRLVEESKRAWHAGQSFWRGLRDINSASIGIELVNPGHHNGYRPFPEAQLAALKTVLADMANRQMLSPLHGLLAHSDVAPLRKEDPGELFPWQALAQGGFGLWPEPRSEDYGPAEDREVQDLLRAIGYDCPETGAYDRPTRAALLAFQRRYEPNNLTGTPERETVARMRALLRLTASIPATSRPSV
ncbi:MAG: N-acetylmuramoyl-L-alanine amidase [Pseudomonadota bacterium]|nr:N-acetylmuramoyl-L-alanine amidase [Pseudomonadota bacterium]